MGNKYKVGDILIQAKPFDEDYEVTGTIVKIIGFNNMDYRVKELVIKHNRASVRVSQLYWKVYIDEAFIKVDNRLIELFYS